MEEKWRNLRELEARRSDVITKLKKIEEKKTTVSAEVYRKVKREYDDKLKKFEEKLSEYIDLVKEETQKLKQEEEKLTNQEREISFKIEEIELRYSIGEYDDASFTKIEEENKAALNKITDGLEKIRERIKGFEDFVELKGLEKTLEEEKEHVPEPAPKKDIQIDEHLLEEKSAEDVKLDELLVPEEIVEPEAPEKKKEAPKQPKESKEEEEIGGVTCPKCGHINPADSWYCEKCGAEILASQSE